MKSGESVTIFMCFLEVLESGKSGDNGLIISKTIETEDAGDLNF